jgi:hypothetical protein
MSLAHTRPGRSGRAAGSSDSEHHHRQTDVQTPEGRGQPAVGMQVAGIQAAQAEQHQADAQHAVDAEQRGMAVGRGHVEPCT